MKEMPVADKVFGLVMVKVRVVTPPTATLAAPKDLLMVSGFRTANVAVAAGPASALVEVKVLVTLL